MVTRGFFGRRSAKPSRPIPPGQYVENGFPVLSAGPTPRTPLNEWTFTIEDDGEILASWSWEEIRALPHTELTTDIHCVTKWSKLDTSWKGVTIDALLENAGIEPADEYVMAFCDGGYTTNLPLDYPCLGVIGHQQAVAGTPGGAGCGGQPAAIVRLG